MSKHDPRVTLMQMREAARRAQSLCHATSLEALRLDWVRRMAFERCFEILGEAIKRLPGELREQYPEHDWRGAAGLRDIVAHGYDWVIMKCSGMRFGMIFQACSPRWSRCCLTWVENCP